MTRFRRQAAPARVALVGPVRPRRQMASAIGQNAEVTAGGLDVDAVLRASGTLVNVILWLAGMPRKAHPAAAVGQAANLFPGVRLMAVVDDDLSEGKVRRMIGAGCLGIVTASGMDESLAACVAAVLAGQVAVPISLMDSLGPPRLSVREKQVLGMVVLGFSNAEVAGQLKLAESTVKSHMSSAFARLGVNSRSEAVALFLRPETAVGLDALRIGPVQAPGDVKRA